MSVLWPGCALPSPEDLVEVEDLDQLKAPQVRSLAKELGIVMTDDPNDETLRARLKASVFN